MQRLLVFRLISINHGRPLVLDFFSKAFIKALPKQVGGHQEGVLAALVPEEALSMNVPFSATWESRPSATDAAPDAYLNPQEKQNRLSKHACLFSPGKVAERKQL